MCQNERVKDADKCIHCHVCQENCSFLKKYGLDIGDTENPPVSLLFMWQMFRSLSGGD